MKFFFYKLNKLCIKHQVRDLLPVILYNNNNNIIIIAHRLFLEGCYHNYILNLPTTPLEEPLTHMCKIHHKKTEIIA